LRHLRPMPVLLVLCLALTGCAAFESYPNETAAARRSFADFSFEAAARYLQKGTGGPVSGLCYRLERGLVLHTNGDYDASNAELLQAAEIMTHYDEKAIISASDTAASAAGLIVNDRLVPYRGEGFEKTLVHTYLALNFLMKKDLGGARVEVRRAYQAQEDEKARHRRQLEKAEDAARKQELDQREVLGRVRNAYRGRQILLKRAGDVYQNAFTAYLSAVIYELNGEINDAYVDCKQVHRLNPRFEPVQRDLLRFSRQLGFHDDYERWQRAFGKVKAAPDDQGGEVLLVFQCGRAPLKRQLRLKVPFRRGYLTMALPRYELQANPVSGARLKVRGMSVGVTEGLNDVEATAVRNLWDELPVIVIRELIRATAKAAAVNASAKKSREEHGRKAGDIVGLIGSIAADLTEQADQRSWTLLPASLQVLRARLPAGTHRMEIELVGSGGGRVGSVAVTAEVRRQGFTLINVRSIGTRARANMAVIR